VNFPEAGNIFQYQSEGIFKQNQVIVNGSIRMGAKLSLFGYYTLNYANSDTSGAGSFPSIPGELQEDYGRASYDIRHRLFVGGTIGLPRGFRLSPFLIASSGIPFNITSGTDPYQIKTISTICGQLSPPARPQFKRNSAALSSRRRRTLRTLPHTRRSPSITAMDRADFL